MSLKSRYESINYWDNYEGKGMNGLHGRVQDLRTFTKIITCISTILDDNIFEKKGKERQVFPLIIRRDCVEVERGQDTESAWPGLALSRAAISRS